MIPLLSLLQGLLLALQLLEHTSLPPASCTLYVATSTTTTLQARTPSGSGSRGQPYTTLEDAREGARRSRSKCSRVTVQLLPGVHTLRDEAALELSALDSHTVWRGGGNAVVSGGVLINNWTVVTPGGGGRHVWEAPWLRKPPRQLFADGVRRPLTRSPVNPSRYHIIEHPILVGNSTTTTAAAGFVYAAAAAGDTEVIPAVSLGSNVAATYFASYCTNTVPVAAVIPANRTVLFAGAPAYWSQVDLGARSRFQLDGILPAEGALAPGQWWVGHGMLRYAPLPGQTTSRTTVVASVATELIRVRGAGGIEFKGIKFKHADGDTPAQPGDCQAGLACTTATIHITRSTDITVNNCSITSVGSFGVWAHGNSSDVTVTGSVLADLGAGGVRFGDGLGGAGGRPNNDWNLRLAVNNTQIADGGQLVAGAPGLLALGNCYNFSFMHNEVTGFPWSGISAGQVSSYAIKTAAGGYNTSASVAVCRQNRLPWRSPSMFHNEIGYNRVWNIATGPDRLADNGGIYAPAIATDIHHNVVSNVSTYNLREHQGLGVYGEGGGCNLTISHNIFHDISGACIDVKWYSVNTAIVNNVCVSVTGAASDGALHSTGGVWNLTITRNIVVVPSAASVKQSTAAVYGGAYCMLTNITKHHVGNLDFSFGTVDRNLYYADPKAGLLNNSILFPNISLPCTDSARFGVPFEVWRRSTAHDAASSNGVAPGFVGDGNYSLRASSMARRIGIESIDTADVGIVGDSPPGA